MDFAPEGSSVIVPDPYYGGAAGFEHVLDLVELACDGLVRDLQVRLTDADSAVHAPTGSSL
jgi:protein-tyrosine phosphatase